MSGRANAVQTVGARVERLVGQITVAFFVRVSERVGDFGETLLGLVQFAGEKARVCRLMARQADLLFEESFFQTNPFLCRRITLFLLLLKRSKEFGIFYFVSNQKKIYTVFSNGQV